MDSSGNLVRRKPQDRVFPIFLGLVILGFFVMLAANISVMYFGSGELSVSGYPYFFILLILLVIPFGISLISMMAVVTLLYIVQFAYLILASRRSSSRRIFQNPSSYIGAFIPFLLLMSVVIVFIEQAMGVKIGGKFISSDFSSAPYSTYLALIYAPFVEELGFRIIPLGALVFCEAIYVAAKKNSKQYGSTARLLAYSFILPGKLRREMGLKMGALEITGVIATSVLFGYAHYYFGAWDPGKIAQAALVGAFLAIGFIEFGPYVDIIMHWFFNGFVSVYEVFVNAFSGLLLGVEFIFLLIAGVAFLYYFIEWKTGGMDTSFNENPVPGNGKFL